MELDLDVEQLRVIDFSDEIGISDPTMVSFVSELFQKFKNVKTLLLKEDHALELILADLGANLKSLSLITIGNRNKGSYPFPHCENGILS